MSLPEQHLLPNRLVNFMSTHKSDSSAQRSAETHILSLLEKSIGATFGESRIPGMSVKPDAVDMNKKIVVEVFARIGKLKSAQMHKVQADILKLAFIDKETGGDWRKIICFGCKEAASFLQGQSWSANAAKSFGIEIKIFEMSGEQKESIVIAQRNQKMVNAT